MPVEREALVRLLEEIDGWCGQQGVEGVQLVMLGGSALSLGWGSPRATKDLDVVVKGKGELDALEQVFGRHTGRRPWLDVVLAGLPRLPEGWPSRTEPVDGTWNHISVRQLAAADLIAAKLKAFRPHDRRDIEFLCTESPDVRTALAALSAADYWMEEDIWEEFIEPRRNRVVDYLDGVVPRL
jgi:hypothetical protein